MTTNSSKLIYGTALIGACAIVCVAIVAQAQYNSYDSDSELGKLVRGSGRMQQNQRHLQAAANAAAAAAAERSMHSQPQAMQFAPTQHRRNFGAPSNPMSAYGPSSSSMGNAGGMSGRASSNADSGDDEEGSNFGPSNFGPSQFDNSNNENDGEGNTGHAGNANVDGPVTGLNQAASGYPSHNDYNNEAAAAAAGFNFDGNFGPSSSADGSDFGPSSSDFGPSEGKRAKSASSPMGSRNFGSEEDAGAPRYGPNSAINADSESEGPENVEGRTGAGYAPQSENDNENDDE